MPRGNTIPKPANQRARRNKDTLQGAKLGFVAGEQPELPADIDWPEQTRTWWAMWGRSPQAVLFSAPDWSALLDTALVHRRHWRGDATAAAELRLREAKFGATLEDRARLRIQLVSADVAEESRPKVSPSEKRYGMLEVVDGEVETKKAG